MVFPLVQKHAYPADELMPLSCRGRVRGMEPSRGDVDDALGKWVCKMGSSSSHTTACRAPVGCKCPLIPLWLFWLYVLQSSLVVRTANWESGLLFPAQTLELAVMCHQELIASQHCLSFPTCKMMVIFTPCHGSFEAEFINVWEILSDLLLEGSLRGEVEVLFVMSVSTTKVHCFPPSWPRRDRMKLVRKQFLFLQKILRNFFLHNICHQKNQ